MISNRNLPAARAVCVMLAIGALGGFGGAAAKSPMVLPTPVVAGVPAYTGAGDIEVAGHTAAKVLVTIERGSKITRTRADSHGNFAATVSLEHDRLNELVIYSNSDNDKIENSPPIHIAITQDGHDPTITATLDPVPNAVGWNHGSVTVRFTCEDSSGIASCTSPVTISVQGANQHVEGVAVDKAGNRRKLDVRVSIDSALPSARIVLSPLPNAAGWNRSSVTASFLCDDTKHASGVVNCPSPVTVKNEGAANPVTVTVTDKAGNTATVSTVVKLDRTPPIVSIAEPRDGALVYTSPVHVTATATDALSGVTQVSCDKSAADVSAQGYACDVPLTLGKHKIHVWATDQAGNIAVAHQHVVLGPELPGRDLHESIALADLNGDGRNDFVRTDFLAGDVVLLLKKSDGTFEPERRVHVGDYPSGLVVADINGDGILDLITTHYTKAEVAIQYGRHDGTYVQGPRIKVDTFPSAVAVRDMNGDGHPDLITGHAHNKHVHVHLAQADGTYAEQLRAEVGDMPVSLAVADVNGDGIPDVVAANFSSGDLSLLLGEGGGRFQKERRIALAPAGSSSPKPAGVVFTDLNGDGIIDIATANFGSDTFAFLLGSGQGVFNAAQSLAAGHEPLAFAAADVTGDGKLDLVTANRGSATFTVLAGQGGGMFGASEPEHPVTPNPVRVAGPTDPTIFSRQLGVASSSIIDMPGPFSAPARLPADGMPAAADRVGMSFGLQTSSYDDLLGPNGMSYVPLVTTGRAGMKWVRIDCDRSFFLDGGYQTYASYSALVDRLNKAGFGVHFVWTYFQKTYDAEFPTKAYLDDFALVAGELAAAMTPNAAVEYEVWNEPDNYGLFWPLRKGVDEPAAFARMVATVTEGIRGRVPGAIVVAGGLTSLGVVEYAPKFLAAYNAQRAGRPLATVTRFGFHPYPVSFDTLGPFRKQLNDAGFAGSAIDITEIGAWDSSQPDANGRAWVSKVNAAILLRSIEVDVPHINFWAALPSPDAMATASFMNVAPGETDGCRGSQFGELSGVVGFKCYPSMIMARVFNRVAKGRTYQGAMFDARTGPLPGADTSNSLSGLRALKFESDEDVVIAVYTTDRALVEHASSGRTYAIRFPIEPTYVLSDSGDEIPAYDATGRHQVSHDGGPRYFFFSKSATPPTETANARVVCADGSTPLRGQVQFWHTVWPTPTASAPLDWQTPGIGTAGTSVTMARALPQFRSHMYVAAEVPPDSGRFLPMLSAAQIGGAQIGPNVTGSTYFIPPTLMAKIDAPVTTTNAYQIQFLALPEWCTP